MTAAAQPVGLRFESVERMAAMSARIQQAEIAEALGISPRAVSMRLYRAFERLSTEPARRA